MNSRFFRTNDFDNSTSSTYAKAIDPDSLTMNKILEAIAKVRDVSRPQLPFDELMCGDLQYFCEKLGVEIQNNNDRLSTIFGIPVRVDDIVPKNKVVAWKNADSHCFYPKIVAIYNLGD